MLLKNIIYGILSIQESFLKKRLSKTIDAKNSSKRKRHYFAGCCIDLSSLADAEKQEFEEKLSFLLKKYEFDPNQLLEYIKSQGTKVYFLDNATKLLNPIRENEGFIYPMSKLKALYLSLSVQKKASFKTEEMFILSKGNINKYYFIYHFYNWFAFKHKIFGITGEAQKLLQKYLYSNADTKTLQLSEIYQLKDAIRQDKAAIEFVIKLCRNYDGTKQALKKIEESGSAKL